MQEVVCIPFHDGEVLSYAEDGKPRVALRRMAQHLGLGWASQRQKLASAPWARVTNIVTQLPGDTQARPTLFGDVRTVLMWLATINPAKVKPERRELLEAYQSEVGDAIEAYWTEGGALNPRGTDEQRYWLAIRALAATEWRSVTDAVAGASDYVSGQSARTFQTIAMWVAIAATGEAWETLEARKRAAKVKGVRDAMTEEELTRLAAVEQGIKSDLILVLGKTYTKEDVTNVVRNAAERYFRLTA